MLRTNSIGFGYSRSRSPRRRNGWAWMGRVGVEWRGKPERQSRTTGAQNQGRGRAFSDDDDDAGGGLPGLGVAINDLCVCQHHMTGPDPRSSRATHRTTHHSTCTQSPPARAAFKSSFSSVQFSNLAGGNGSWQHAPSGLGSQFSSYILGIIQQPPTPSRLARSMVRSLESSLYPDHVCALNSDCTWPSRIKNPTR